jgi:hypothetical protein
MVVHLTVNQERVPEVLQHYRPHLRIELCTNVRVAVVESAIRDILLTVGGIRVTDQQFGDAFRDRFRDAPDGTPVEFEVQRGAELLALDGALRFETTVIRTVEPDPAPSPAAAAIRDGILRGRG